MTPGNSNKTWMWGGVSAGLLAAGFLGLVIMGALKPQPEVAERDDTVITVKGEPIIRKSGAIPVSGSGRVQAFEQVQLQAQLSGDVTYVSPALQAGAHIEKGERLLSINAASLLARKTELEAQLASAAADLNLAKTQADRSQKLLDLRAASQEEVDQRNASVAAAEARVAQLQASVERVEIDLGRSTITAPFDGRVLRETVSVGDVVAPGAVFAEIYSTQTFEIPIALPQKEAALIDGLYDAGPLDLPADVTVSYGGAKFVWDGRVHRVEPGLDETSRTIDLIIRVDRPETRGLAVVPTNVEAPPLLLGMFASVEVSSRDLGDFVELPRDALRPDNTVWYVAADEAGAGVVEVADVSVIKTANAVAYGKLQANRSGQVHILSSVSGRVVPGAVVILSSENQANGNPDIALSGDGEAPR